MPAVFHFHKAPSPLVGEGVGSEGERANRKILLKSRHPGLKSVTIIGSDPQLRDKFNCPPMSLCGEAL